MIHRTTENEENLEIYQIVNESIRNGIESRRERETWKKSNYPSKFPSILGQNSKHQQRYLKQPVTVTEPVRKTGKSDILPGKDERVKPTPRVFRAETNDSQERTRAA